MDPMYTAFATRDALFYDVPARADLDVSPEFEVDASEDWSGWNTLREDHWVHWLPRGLVLPDQGWKIHISTTPATADKTLLTTSAYCGAHAVPFKHVRSSSTLLSALAKDADRGSAGKFITLYPPTVDALEEHLVGLEQLLGGAPGPYILSDLRWNQGPLFVRYGAFTRITTLEDGRTVPAIRDPRSDALVPDQRQPYFQVPAWVEVPRFLQQQIDSLDHRPPAGFPKITAALHHSNSGGVYAADLNGRGVILKEARPHSGWTPDGRDAVTRLVHEEQVLSALPVSVSAPRPVGHFEAHGHRFLALERIAGESLANLVVMRNPITSDANNAADYEAYRDWALRIATSVRAQVDQLHASGVVHGDLHPRNVLVDDNDRVTLVDFEVSTLTSSDEPPLVGVAGFVPPDTCSPAERDLYAVACLELFLFLPLTPVLALAPTKPIQLLREAAMLFDLDHSWVKRQLAVLAPAGGRKAEPASASMQLTSQQVANQLRADAQPWRSDRLWPGDPRQFSEARYSLGFGALGVASALKACGVSLSEQQSHWIHASLETDLAEQPLGLMNGLAGAVWGCRALEWHCDAERVLEALRRSHWYELDTALYAGIPGVALTLLANAARQPTDAELALEMWTSLRERVRSAEVLTRVPTDGGGLFGGTSGTALLSMRLYDHFHDEEMLSFAEEAIERDLATLAEAPDGSLHTNEGWRLLPYLGYGSAGIGLLLAELLTHGSGTNRQRDALTAILRAACAPFTVQSGLLHGRAGLIHFLGAAERLGFSSPHVREAAERHVNALQLHALPTIEGARFVGNGLLRASCDFASGSAGVLAVLTAREVGSVPPSSPLRILEPFSHDPVRGNRSLGGGDNRGISSVTSGAGAPS